MTAADRERLYDTEAARALRASMLLALDALRAASLWFTLTDLDYDCDFANGDQTFDKLSADERAAPIREKIDRAIAAITGEPIP